MCVQFSFYSRAQKILLKKNFVRQQFLSFENILFVTKHNFFKVHGKYISYALTPKAKYNLCILLHKCSLKFSTKVPRQSNGGGGKAVFFKEENFFQITRQSHARKDEFRPLPHIIHDN